MAVARCGPSRSHKLHGFARETFSGSGGRGSDGGCCIGDGFGSGAAGAAGAVTVATAARGRWQWRQPVDGRPAGLRPDCFDSFGFQKISDGFRFRGWPVRHSRAPSREHKSADFCQDRPPTGAVCTVTARRILLLRSGGRVTRQTKSKKADWGSPRAVPRPRDGG